MITYLALISLFSLFYAYFGYPFVLYFLDKAREGDENEKIANPPETISIIIAARNESASIEKKILQTLGLEFDDSSLAEELLKDNSRVQIIVADDASTDDTAEIVRSFAARGIELSSLPERGGKEKSQKKALELVRSEIILFTDSKIVLSKDSIDNVRWHFADSSIGAVSSVDHVIDESSSSGEGLYVKYEMKIRELESRLSSLVGLSGSCFAVRREVANELDVRFPSDFSLLMAAVRKGLRGRHAPDVVGTYHAVVTPEQEFQRKVRTVLRGMHALFSNPDLLNPARYGFFSFQLISHKIYRWAVPIFFILLFFTSYFLAKVFFWKLVWLVMFIFIILGVTGYLAPAYKDRVYLKIPLFLLVSNLAIAVAWIKYFKGERSYLWDPSKKG